MATINDLLYNYQETNEFVCSDGRMSVNGICQVDQPDSVDTTEITKKIIETSKDGKDNKEFEEKVKRDKILKDLEGTSDYYPELGKEKGKFQWDFDKESKIENYKNTINNNITAYNNFIEENLGIPSDFQNVARVGSTIAAASGGGILMAVAPWAIPVLAGGAINRAEGGPARVNRPPTPYPIIPGTIQPGAQLPMWMQRFKQSNMALYNDAYNMVSGQCHSKTQMNFISRFANVSQRQVESSGRQIENMFPEIYSAVTTASQNHGYQDRSPLLTILILCIIIALEIWYLCK